MSIDPDKIPEYIEKMIRGDLKGVPLPVVEGMGLQGSAVRAEILQAPVGVEPDPKRKCGPCTACCSTLGIEASPGEKDLGLVSFVKVAGLRCRYEKKEGCRKYKRRPLSCRIYSCWWRRGWGSDDMRPDTFNVIADNGINQEFLEGIGPMPLASLAETRPGVFAPKSAAHGEQHPLIQHLAETRIVLVRWWGDEHPTRMFGPPAFIDRIEAVERAKGLRP